MKRWTKKQRDKWRKLVRDLKRDWPCPDGSVVSVRRMRVPKNEFAVVQYAPKSGKWAGVFRIQLSRDRDYFDAIHDLLHEYAHVLAAIEGHYDHDTVWGRHNGHLYTWWEQWDEAQVQRTQNAHKRT